MAGQAWWQSSSLNCFDRRLSLIKSEGWKKLPVPTGNIYLLVCSDTWSGFKELLLQHLICINYILKLTSIFGVKTICEGSDVFQLFVHSLLGADCEISLKRDQPGKGREGSSFWSSCELLWAKQKTLEKGRELLLFCSSPKLAGAGWLSWRR